MSTTLFPLLPDNYSFFVDEDEFSMNVIKNSICRLCLQTHEKLVNIFDEEDVFDTNEISRYIEIFFAVQITKTDPFSTYVCKPCWNTIITLSKYRLQFRKNDALLCSKKENTIPETTWDDSITCHYSVKSILSQGINLNINYWDKNFDVKVNLSESKIPDEIFNNNKPLQTAVCSNKEKPVSRSSKQVTKRHSIHKRRSSVKYQDNWYPSDSSDSIALNRSKRHMKRTKIFGDPLSLADDDADDSDSDPVFSILKKYTCESSPEILPATNIPIYLTRSTDVHFNNHNPSPKRVCAQKARKTLARWLNPEKRTKSTERRKYNMYRKHMESVRKHRIQKNSIE